MSVLLTTCNESLGCRTGDMISPDSRSINVQREFTSEPYKSRNDPMLSKRQAKLVIDIVTGR
ncbi:MAG: hypothetical protein NTY19_28390 [Planctomycetota bacterium]|nr:hypothetical protein [Planctomycetota bacterium]